MRIEVNPNSLFKLEGICEVLYKLHPYVLDYLLDMERTLGPIFGGIMDVNNMTLDQREILTNIIPKVDFSTEKVEVYKDPDRIYILRDYDEKDEKSLLLKVIKKFQKEYYDDRFRHLRKYIQLSTDDYIPMKLYVEVEDNIIGKKVKKLVEALQNHEYLDEFTLNKKELDEDAYFAGQYNDFELSEEARKQRDDFLDKKDEDGLRELLKKEKLYP